MKKLAETILLAAKLREGSYDHEGANHIVSNYRQETHIDFKQFYKLTMYGACDKAVKQINYDHRGTKLIYLLLTNSWNETLDWANSIVEGNK